MFIEKTMFEAKVSNGARNSTQNVAGKFGTGTGTTFVGADCSAGLLCVRNGLIPVSGYEDIVDSAGNPRILNGNTWYFNAANNGASGGAYGDHTGIYAFNNYDVNIVGSGDQQYHLGMNTLGLGLPNGNMGDFTEIIIGEQYQFGAGNFSTLPSAANMKYITIANGLLVASASAPAGGSGVYFELLRTTNVTEGVEAWGTGYVVVAKRTAEAAA